MCFGKMDDFIYQNDIYLLRGKLEKSFNSLSKRKFHLANFTTMRNTKFFKLQRMVTNDEKW